MATTGKINGKDMLLYLGGTAISHSETCSLNFTQGEVPVTTKDSANWEEILPGVRSWTMDCNGMVALDATYGLDEFYALMNSQASATLKFATDDAADRFWSGTAYITGVTEEAPNETGVSFSISFKGTGKLKWSKT